MKKLIYKNPTAQKIYDSYFKRVSRCVSILSPNDQLELQMELNSHIYEATNDVAPDKEVEALIEALEKLGAPEEMLQPAIADKKIKQASRSFNPKHVLQAMYLNVSSGLGYLTLAFVYLLIVAFGMLVILKLLFADNTGLFLKDGRFKVFGFTPTVPAGSSEVLGYWFIPLVIIIMLVAYFLNTSLLRLLKKQ
ncbi:MAG TPA: hypothetical protein VGN20_25295 [Mucilaginibacter sp.]|jgi:hypothetical protein